MCHVCGGAVERKRELCCPAESVGERVCRGWRGSGKEKRVVLPRRKRKGESLLGVAGQWKGKESCVAPPEA